MPLTKLLNTMSVIALSEQMVCDDGVAVTSGVGSTNTVAVIDEPGQLFADGVMVNVTVTGALVVLVSEPETSPLPLAAIPVTLTLLFLVHE